MGQSVQPATRNAGSRSPAWTREEAILALDLYVRCGVANGGPMSDENDPHVIALSRELRLLRAHPASLAPMPSPPGMPAFSALDRAVFEEYFDHGFDGLAEDALAIRTTAGRSGGPAAPARVQERPAGNAGVPAYENAGVKGGRRTRAQFQLVSR